MALFGKRGVSKAQGRTIQAGEAVRLVMGRKVYCRVCADERQFTKCWLRTQQVSQCPCCGLVFEKPSVLYRKFQPACPKCGEFLEQPGFEYGYCDGCGSKFELVEGGKPGWLPNLKQRQEMDKHGRIWRPD